MDEGSLSLPPFTGYDEKSQRNYHLALRGNSLNPMIDAATPLLGMVMRLSTMNSQTMPEHLFAQVVTDVQAVEQLLQEQGYEPGVIISFRYILCTFIDEAALGNGWSNKNEWIKQSLLVHFHNELWDFAGATKWQHRIRGNLSRSTAVCTTFCINCAAMPLSRCYTRTKKPRAGVISSSVA